MTQITVQAQGIDGTHHMHSTDKSTFQQKQHIVEPLIIGQANSNLHCLLEFGFR
jgi:hypothetical protein